MNDRYLDEAVAVTDSGKRVPILTLSLIHI